jgi:hypothetical protein
MSGNVVGIVDVSSDGCGAINPGASLSLLHDFNRQVFQTLRIVLASLSDPFGLILVNSSTNPRGNFHPRLIEAMASPRPTSC